MGICLKIVKFFFNYIISPFCRVLLMIVLFLTGIHLLTSDDDEWKVVGWLWFGVFLLLNVMACFVVLPYVIIFWVTFAILLGVSRIPTDAEKQEKKQAAIEKQKKFQAKKEQYERNVAAIVNHFDTDSNRYFLFDSNIWMGNSDDISFLLDILLKKTERGKAIILLPSQLDEIEKLKKKKDADLSFKAREALRRIEEFTDRKKLVVATDKFFNRVRGYADANIVDFVQSICPENIRFSVLTEDRPLRIRLKGVIAAYHAEQNVKVEEPADWLS